MDKNINILYNFFEDLGKYVFKVTFQASTNQGKWKQRGRGVQVNNTSKEASQIQLRLKRRHARMKKTNNK